MNTVNFIIFPALPFLPFPSFLLSFVPSFLSSSYILLFFLFLLLPSFPFPPSPHFHPSFLITYLFPCFPPFYISCWYSVSLCCLSWPWTCDPLTSAFWVGSMIDMHCCIRWLFVLPMFLSNTAPWLLIFHSPMFGISIINDRLILMSILNLFYVILPHLIWVSAQRSLSQKDIFWSLYLK